MTRLDPDVCYRALRAHDERFDGRFFVAVTTTKIYCRPICPASPAKREHCRFYLSAAAAQEDGFRPCLRCRPETAPEHGAWRGTSNTVSRGLALIAEGALDGDEAKVEALAERLGVGDRQLRRLFKQHLGASPVAVAQTRRVLFAKQLIHDTQLPMGEVALASGFGSVRRFNETFQLLFQRPPGALRRKRKSTATSGVTVQLRYRPPYDWASMLAFLRERAISGVEQVDGEIYRRSIGDNDWIEISHRPAAQAIVATIHPATLSALPSIVTRIRRVFDLGADTASISAHLAKDPMLRTLVAKHPGLRLPCAWDGFELAVRAVLGQQVSLNAGRALTEQLVVLCGGRVNGPLSLRFANAAEVAAADLAALKMPDARRQALWAIAHASLADASLFQPLAGVEQTVERLKKIRGIGDWTAHYIALRAAREPDAFPSSDIGLLRSASRKGVRPSAAELEQRAERWRPWRGYAAQYLWTHKKKEGSHE